MLEGDFKGDSILWVLDFKFDFFLVNFRLFGELFGKTLLSNKLESSEF